MKHLLLLLEWTFRPVWNHTATLILPPPLRSPDILFIFCCIYHFKHEVHLLCNEPGISEYKRVVARQRLGKLVPASTHKKTGMVQ
jgi:hypothetical protein